MARYRRALIAAIVLGSAPTVSAAPSATTTPVANNGTKIVSVTLFLRHGIRAPLPDEIPAIAGPGITGGWHASPGMLTKNGYENARRLATWLGREWRAERLLPAGCPTSEELYVRSNNAPRTIASASALLVGLAPGCRLKPARNPAGQPDRIFDPLGAGITVDAQEVRRTIPSDGAVLWRPYSAEIGHLQALLGCAPRVSSCGLQTIPGGPITVDEKGVHLDARSRAYAGIAQGLLLRYAEGLPLPHTKSGTIGAADIERVSRLHAVPFVVEARSPSMARTLSAPFLGELRKQWSPEPRQAHVRVFVGHDNVLSAVAAQLGIDFKAPGYGLNDPPVGGGLGFELLEGPDGKRRVRGFYVAQSPDQLRRLSPLMNRSRPWKHFVTFRGCPQDAERGCPLTVFRTLAEPAAS